MGQSILLRVITAAVGLYLLTGAHATYRALRPPRVAVEASRPGGDGAVDLTVTVDTSGRGDTEVAVDLLGGAGKRRLREWTVDRRRFAFWDPRPRHHVTRLRVPVAGEATGPERPRIRVSAQTQSWWLTRRAPVSAEIDLVPRADPAPPCGRS
jgi:hypothetical protein